MENNINLLQIKKQMNTGHLVVLYQKGENIKEYDLSMGIEESKKKIITFDETKRFLMGDQSAKPDLSIVHDNPHMSAFYWREYGPEDQEKMEKGFILGLSSDIKKLEKNIRRAVMLIQDYHSGFNCGLRNEFTKYIEEVVEEGNM